MKGRREEKGKEGEWESVRRKKREENELKNKREGRKKTER